jgi:hypothetical protein
MDTGHMLAMATCEYTLSLNGEMVLRGFWQDQQFLLQEHHLHRCIMVVHVLLRVVVGLVSAATLLDHFSLTSCFQVYSSTLTCCSGIPSGHYAL